MAGEWKEGDVVRLKSGGPKMIVDLVVRYSDESESVHCIWFDNNQKRDCDSVLYPEGCGN